MVRFVHIADCHAGAWREPKMRELNLRSFSLAVDQILSLDIDFVLISGDLFNNALPSIDTLKIVIESLKKLSDNGIKVYGIAGSHDFSPSGKSMVTILEKAHLFENVMKGEVGDDGKLNLEFVVDKKTGVKLAGIIGKRGTLEKKYYKELNYEKLEQEEGQKVFLFHTAINEFKPKELKEMPGANLSLLPKGFNYYAGGHVHYRFRKDEPEFGPIVYPGPLFPNNFKELHDLECGSYMLVDLEKKEYVSKKIIIKSVKYYNIDVGESAPEEIYDEIISRLEGENFVDSLVLLRIEGKLKNGSMSDINFERLSSEIYSRGAYFILRNTQKLRSPYFEEIKLEVKDIDNLEHEVIDEHLNQSELLDSSLIKLDEINQRDFITNLMNLFSIEKDESQRIVDFEDKIKKEFEVLIDERKV